MVHLGQRAVIRIWINLAGVLESAESGQMWVHASIILSDVHLLAWISRCSS